MRALRKDIDDGTLAVDTSIPALYVTRVLHSVKAERGLPKVIRTDNDPEFAGRTMQDRAARNEHVKAHRHSRCTS